MKKNVGKIDRYARIIIGVAAMGAGFAFESWWGALGLVPLVTAFIKWCPAYSLLRFNTCNPFGKGGTCSAESAG